MSCHANALVLPRQITVFVHFRLQALRHPDKGISFQAPPSMRKACALDAVRQELGIAFMERFLAPVFHNPVVNVKNENRRGKNPAFAPVQIADHAFNHLPEPVFTTVAVYADNPADLDSIQDVPAQ